MYFRDRCQQLIQSGNEIMLRYYYSQKFYRIPALRPCQIGNHHTTVNKTLKSNHSWLKIKDQFFDIREKLELMA